MKLISKFYVVLSLVLFSTLCRASQTAETANAAQPVAEKKIAVTVSPDGLEGNVVHISVGHDACCYDPRIQRILPPEGRSDLLDAFVKLISALAWPLVVVAIIFQFRDELRILIPRLKSLKVGSAGFDFADEVERAADEADIPRTLETASIGTATVLNASADPRGTILSAWLDVESALSGLVENRQLAVGYTRISKRPLTAIRLVQKAGLLDEKYVALFQDLRVLRNEAAQSIDFLPPPDSVVRFVQLSKELASEIRKQSVIPTS